MRRNHLAAPLVMIASAVGVLAGEPTAEQAANWHQWRGPLASGVSTTAKPPTTWSEDENVRWKVPIDGVGNSTPIVWDDRVFLTTAIPTDEVDPNKPKPEDQPQRPFGIKYPNNVHRFVVLCLDRATGRELWRKVAAEKVPHRGTHGDNTHASPSPTTDGERLYVWFGSIGLFCYDLEGGELWKRPFGEVETRLSFGEGSSPVVHGDRLILVRDHEGPSTITVLDTSNGDVVWEKSRDEPSAWATPLVVEHDGTTQVVTNGKNRIRSYDLADGRLIWECGGQVSNVTPSPVTNGEHVFCASGYRGSALQAIPLSATGDVTGTDTVAWSLNRATPYVPSLLLYDDLLYFTQSNDGILSAADPATGEVLLERTRLEGLRGLYASPVAAAGRVYVPGRRGTTVVLEHGPEGKFLATNRLDEGTSASPAVAGNQLFIRGERHLYCLEQSSGE